MTFRLTAPKELIAGIFYVMLGGSFLLMAILNYRIGTPDRIGPGFFPAILSGLIVLVGVAALVRSVVIKGEALEKIAWRPLAVVTLSVLVFAFALRPLGFFIAALAMVGISATASALFYPNIRAVLGVVAFVVVCAVVFIYLLGVPMPIGPVFG